jgi:hypothetical protein
MRVLAVIAVAAVAQTARAGFAEDTCAAGDLIGPTRPFENPTGKTRCCAGAYGKGNFASCDTSSCVNNFGQKNLNCFNYGFENNKDKGNGNGNGNGNNAGSSNCPYADDDKAFCDVSAFIGQDGTNCKTLNGKNHCLGYVVCGTDGYDLDTPGVPQPGGTEPCSWGTADQICVYNGNSENWKVCGAAMDDTDVSDPDPTDVPDEEACTEWELIITGDAVYRCMDARCEKHLGTNAWEQVNSEPEVYQEKVTTPGVYGDWEATQTHLQYTNGNAEYIWPWCCDCEE